MKPAKLSCVSDDRYARVMCNVFSFLFYLDIFAKDNFLNTRTRKFIRDYVQYIARELAVVCDYEYRDIDKDSFNEEESINLLFDNLLNSEDPALYLSVTNALRLYASEETKESYS